MILKYLPHQISTTAELRIRVITICETDQPKSLVAVNIGDQYRR